MALSPSSINKTIELGTYHSPPFRSEVVERASCLCLIHALQLHIEATKSFRCSEQLFFFYSRKNKGHTVLNNRSSTVLLRQSNRLMRQQVNFHFRFHLSCNQESGCIPGGNKGVSQQICWAAPCSQGFITIIVHLVIQVHQLFCHWLLQLTKRWVSVPQWTNGLNHPLCFNHWQSGRNSAEPQFQPTLHM